MSCRGEDYSRGKRATTDRSCRSPSLAGGAWPEYEDVLPRQDVDDAIEAIALCFELHTRLADAHLVLRADRDGRILLAELDQDQPAVRLEGAPQRLQEGLRLRQLVVDVHHQREIDRPIGQPRFGGR